MVLPYTLYFFTRYRAVGYTFYTFPLLPGISSHVLYVYVVLFFIRIGYKGYVKGYVVMAIELSLFRKCIVTVLFGVFMLS